MLEIALATDADAAWLDQHQPSGGMPDVHRQRLALQQSGAAAYLVARLDGRPAGCVLLHARHPDHHASHAHFPDCAYVEGLDVEVAARRQGIGEALMIAAEAHADPAAVIGLSVGLDNDPARGLYRKLGYQPSGIPDYPVTWNYTHPVTGEIGEEGEICSFWLKPAPG
jgi:ribosomal protein S18 acetylase RimI-like enzyme